MAKDYYSILGVSRSADAAAIHSAFRTLARRYHPDTGRASSPPKFREAVEAYETLRDPVRRRQHDIDLGLVASQRPAAEPLFALRDTVHRRRQYAAPPPSFDELLAEMFRFFYEEFESLRFF